MKNIFKHCSIKAAIKHVTAIKLQLNTWLPTDIDMEDIPLTGFLSLAEYNPIKAKEEAWNTDFDMREFLGIDKALQNVKGELVNKF